LRLALQLGALPPCLVEFDRATGLTRAPRPLSEFPTPAALRALAVELLELDGTLVAELPAR